MDKKTTNIGFIGLGIMGLPMSINLLKAGFQVYGYARNPAKCSSFKKYGGQLLPTAKTVGEKADVLIIIVTDSPQVDEVLFSSNGAAEGLKQNTMVIDMSTISPIESKKISDKLAQQGVRMLDAPVSGGEIGAIEGKLSIMIGGDKKDVEEAKPILEVMGENIVHVGSHSSGQLCKSCNQMMVAQVINAVADTLNYAEAAGADLLKIREALMGGFAASRILEFHGLRMINKDYQAGFKSSLHLKDLNIVEKTAKNNNFYSAATNIAKEKIIKLIERGDGDLDTIAIQTLQ